MRPVYVLSLRNPTQTSQPWGGKETTAEGKLPIRPPGSFSLSEVQGALKSNACMFNRINMCPGSVRLPWTWILQDTAKEGSVLWEAGTQQCSTDTVSKGMVWQACMCAWEAGSEREMYLFWSTESQNHRAREAHSLCTDKETEAQ